MKRRLRVKGEFYAEMQQKVVLRQEGEKKENLPRLFVHALCQRFA